MINTRLFEGKEYSLLLYNGQALIDKAFRFFTVYECVTEGVYEEIDFDFPDFISGYFRVYNERSGRLIKDFTLTKNAPYLIANISVSDMTFEDNGNYYYEIGYNRGGYELSLRYGILKVI